MNRSVHAFLLGLLLASPVAGAADISMADGAIRFPVPDNWVPIMQSQGETETQIFQVPGANAANATLARVSVTLQKVPNLNGFQQFSGNMRSRASGLTEYAAGKANSPTENVYKAKEGTVTLDYYERYFYSGGYAIQLRCIRPGGDAKWSAAFDKGCADLAARMPS
ncbi:MAG: hypothetical protein AAGC76_08780 [Luteibacter sp.]|uniref:hypothetical protein n=1 Tax=Rhodanobacteraceae TaxID=1775411 RepID=UPI000890FC9F|nr:MULTISPECIES: hypothetical protein [Rhodanobacteraceae]MDQ7995935.1 hypothetical protein [Luteibacter sp.]MDQ8050564.1 hypothetical protein [Luteibacter sp.]MDR6644060.1 hypothetical protein [Luteibacter sp. 1214]SDF21393.1 hypothetical protein SAMN04515659_0405 [Dyella sp. 333MFSha]SKC03164.1 hypothetical protein SAMN05660880_03841 [Luteibacter sp. 22Crub2.1]